MDTTHLLASTLQFPAPKGDEFYLNAPELPFLIPNIYSWSIPHVETSSCKGLVPMPNGQIERQDFITESDDWNLLYQGAEPPVGYKCSDCGAEGCKLWRNNKKLDDVTTYLCVECTCHSEQRNAADIDERGEHMEAFNDIDILVDEIGRFTRVIPAQIRTWGDSIWYYGDEPQAAVDWWTRLPLRSVTATATSVPQATN